MNTYRIYEEVVGGTTVYCAYERDWIERLLRLRGRYIGCTLSYTVDECESKIHNYIHRRTMRPILVKEIRP